MPFPSLSDAPAFESMSRTELESHFWMYHCFYLMADPSFEDVPSDISSLNSGELLFATTHRFWELKHLLILWGIE